MLRMVSHPRRPQSGHLTCYLNRTYHVLPTHANLKLTTVLPAAILPLLFSVGSDLICRLVLPKSSFWKWDRQTSSSQTGTSQTRTSEPAAEALRCC